MNTTLNSLIEKANRLHAQTASKYTVITCRPTLRPTPGAADTAARKLPPFRLIQVHMPLLDALVPMTENKRPGRVQFVLALAAQAAADITCGMVVSFVAGFTVFVDKGAQTPAFLAGKEASAAVGAVATAVTLGCVIGLSAVLLYSAVLAAEGLSICLSLRSNQVQP